MCKQGSRSPSWFPHCSVMPDPSSPPLLPLPRAPPAFSTAGDHQEQGTGRKNLGKADFSSPVMSINSLKKIYLKACRLVSLTLPFVQHVPCTCGTLQGLEGLPQDHQSPLPWALDGLFHSQLQISSYQPLILLTCCFSPILWQKLV